MTTAEQFRNAWDHAFDEMTIYGEHSNEIRDALVDIADDRIDSAVRDLEAIHAEDDDDHRDQVCDIVQDFLADVKSHGDDLIGNGFDHETAESVIYSLDVMEYFRDNEDECERAFFECSYMDAHSSVRDVIEAAVFYHISQQVSSELYDALEELEYLEDEIMAFLGL